MAHGLTRFDIVQIRRTARELREDYDLGRYDGPSTVMLSEGYAEVDFDPDDEGMALLTRQGRTVGVRMKDGPSRVGVKRKAGSKTSARKRVPSKRVANPRGTPKDAAERWTIRREPLNNGGYTSSGEYFGRGAPLFVYEGQLPAMKSHLYGEYGPSSVGRDVYGHVRASDRASAIAKVLQKYPSAKFYGVRKVANPARKRKPAAKRAVAPPSSKSQRPIKVRVDLYDRAGRLDSTHTIAVFHYSSQFDAKQRAKQSLRGTVHFDTGMKMKASIPAAKRAPARRKAR